MLLSVSGLDEKTGTQSGAFHLIAHADRRSISSASYLIAVFPKADKTKMLVRQAVSVLNITLETVETLRVKMEQIVSLVPPVSFESAYRRYRRDTEERNRQRPVRACFPDWSELQIPFPEGLPPACGKG